MSRAFPWPCCSSSWRHTWAGGRSLILLRHKAVDAATAGDRVEAVRVRSLESGNEVVLRAPYFVDATELGDLLPLTKTEYVTGAESQKDTGEPHAPAEAAPRQHAGVHVLLRDGLRARRGPHD